MQSQCSVLCIVLVISGIFATACVRAEEFRGQVLDRDSKQPVAAVIVQAFSMTPGPDGQRVVAITSTNAKGKFILPLPSRVNAQALSLIVTRQRSSENLGSLGGQSVLVTSFKGVIAMKAHPALKGDNVLYANVSPHKAPPKHETTH